MKLKRIFPEWPEYPGNYRTDEAPRTPSAEARKHCGPSRAVCAVCGEEIGAYESRCYGEAGAVHVWKPNAVAELGNCVGKENRHKFPYYYTDG